MRKTEYLLEATLFQSRWLLAPFYVGLVIGLFGLLIHFIRQLVEFMLHLPSSTESDVILGVLALIDVVLVGNLVLIVSSPATRISFGASTWNRMTARNGWPRSISAA